MCVSEGRNHLRGLLLVSFFFPDKYAHVSVPVHDNMLMSNSWSACRPVNEHFPASPRAVCEIHLHVQCGELTVFCAGGSRLHRHWVRCGFWLFFLLYLYQRWWLFLTSGGGPTCFEEPGHRSSMAGGDGCQAPLCTCSPPALSPVQMGGSFRCGAGTLLKAARRSTPTRKR